MNIIWVEKDELRATASKWIKHTPLILDVGTGIRPQGYYPPKVHICVEPYLPYIERHQQESNHASKYVYLNCTWDVAMSLLPAKSVDSVFAIDVIEHLTKEDGFKFLEQAERVARHQIIIFTPLGYYPQSYDETSVRDRWNMDGGIWQAHHSGWMPEDFGEKWDFVCCKNFHDKDQHNQPIDEPIGALWAFYNLSSQEFPRRKFSDELSLPEKSLDYAKRIARRVKRVVNGGGIVVRPSEKRGKV